MLGTSEEWRTFLVELHKVFGAGMFNVKDILERLDAHTMNGSRLDSAALPGDLPQKWGFVKDGKDGGFRKSLGWWLRNHEGRYAGDWTLLSAGKDGYKVPRYYVKTAGAA
jgi:hypothetical protein